MEYWQLKEYEKRITKDNELLEKQSYLLSICDKGVLAKFEFKIASIKTEKTSSYFPWLRITLQMRLGMKNIKKYIILI